MVLTTSFFFAAKGTAKQAAREKMIRNGSDPGEFFKVPFKETGVQYSSYNCHELTQHEDMMTRTVLYINFQPR